MTTPDPGERLVLMYEATVRPGEGKGGEGRKGSEGRRREGEE